jgi:hypothetical protein
MRGYSDTTVTTVLSGEILLVKTSALPPPRSHVHSFLILNRFILFPTHLDWFSQATVVSFFQCYTYTSSREGSGWMYTLFTDRFLDGAALGLFASREKYRGKRYTYT